MKLRVCLLILTVAIFMVSLSLQAGDLRKVPLGEKLKVEGVIVQKSRDSLRVRNHDGYEFQVVLGDFSDIQEKRKNFFRYPDSYSEDELILGLNLRIEGHGDTSGSLIGEKIRFTRNELQIARTISSQTTLIEAEISDVENRMNGNQNRTDAKLQRLNQKSEGMQNQVEELNVAYRLARQEARHASEKADGAIDRIVQAENRILDLDNYIEIINLDISFKFNSAVLTDVAKVELDEVIHNLPGLEGYLIEVIGFASNDGNPEYNKKLSQRRAEGVTNYLAEQHAIPLWRLVRPFGFGELHPVGDNSTKQGREQNRRVEVRLLQSQGIAGTSSTDIVKPQIVTKTSSR